MSKKEKEQKERTRREYAKAGERSQKMVSFRADNEILEWLYAKQNKGRYLNNLVVEDMKKCDIRKKKEENQDGLPF